MKKTFLNKRNILKIAIGAGLTWILVIGIQNSFQMYQNQGIGIFNQLTGLGRAGEILAISMLFIGSIIWILNWFFPWATSEKVSLTTFFPQVIISLVVYLLTLIILIYTSTLRIMVFSWAAPVLFLGLITLLKLPQNNFCLKCVRQIHINDLISGVILFILVSSLQQYKQAAPIEPFWRGLYYVLAVINGGLFTIVTLFTHTHYQSWITKLNLSEIRNRIRFGLAILNQCVIPLAHLSNILAGSRSNRTGNHVETGIPLVIRGRDGFCSREINYKIDLSGKQSRRTWNCRGYSHVCCLSKQSFRLSVFINMV